jgi:hypothetical protein
MRRKIELLMIGLVCSWLVTSIGFAETINLVTTTGTDPTVGTLATPGYFVTDSNGVIWKIIDAQSTGTGVFQPFLRLQNNGIEQGLNTDASKVLDNIDGIWTHSVLWSTVGTIQIGSEFYYDLALDINEPDNASDRFLSLDVLQLYSGSTGNATSTQGLTMNFSAGDKVLLDYALSNSGSGQADIEVLIPINLVQNPNEYFYLYSQFGAVGSLGQGNTSQDYKASDGFEEWSMLSQSSAPSNVPEPASLLLSGTGLVTLAWFGRKRSRGVFSSAEKRQNSKERPGYGE